MLYLDTETFCDFDISVGTHAYAEKCDIMLLSYAVGDGPAKVWDRTTGEPMPQDLDNALWEVNDGERLVTAHHAAFDRTVCRHVLPGLVPTKPEQWRCTMVKALAHSFPGALERLCKIFELGADKAKLADGKALINRFCKPAPKNHKADRYDRHTDPEKWERFKEYARMDIVSMRELDKLLPDWNYRGAELDLYLLDQKINDRGFHVDQDLVLAGARAAVDEKEALAKRFRELTRGVVDRPSLREQFRKFLNEKYCLSLANTQSATFKELLKAGDLDPECAELMQISISANKSSTAKYATLAPAVSKDGRFRGGLQFNGASRTRRWAGRVFQPQNLPSRGLPPQEDIESYIEALKAGCHDLLFDDLMLHGSAALRGVVVAPEGRQICVSDLSNIEGRANAWLAIEKWKLEAFRAYDRGEGPDLYNVTAGSLIGKAAEEINKTERNIMGKVPELALGYQGGVGAFQTFSTAYGVKMADHWDVIRSSLDSKFVFKAVENFDAWGYKSGLDRQEWIASEAVKLGWRNRHPAISRLWKLCEEAAVRAVRSPGTSYSVNGRLKFRCVKHRGFRYLLVRLPSGNFLCYFAPRVDEEGKLSYMGQDAVTKQWKRLSTYGGKIVENACQSLSRDVMGYNMPRIEAAGFQIVLTVHDEVVTETPIGDLYTAENLSANLRMVPEWAEGFPLAASGFVADRYQKD